MSGIILDADQIHEGISHGFIRLPHEDQVCYVDLDPMSPNDMTVTQIWDSQICHYKRSPGENIKFSYLILVSLWAS